MPLSLTAAVLFVCGSAAGVLLPTTLVPPLAAASGCLFVAAWLARGWRHDGAAQALAVAGALCGIVAHAAGVAERTERPPLMRWFEERTAETRPGEPRLRDVPIRVRGHLRRDAVRTETGAQLQLDVTQVETAGAWTPMTGGLAVTVSGSLLEPFDSWRAGRRLVLPVALRRPVRYRNAGVADQARSLARRGTPLVGSTKSGALVQVEAPAAWWDERAADLRARVRQAMRTFVAPHSSRSAAIGVAILIGERAELEPSVERQLQEAGTYHVVAISGGNIAILAGGLLAVLWCAGVRFEAASAVTMLVLVAHAWIIGGGASVARATVMACIYLALRVIDQRTAPLHAISVAAAAVLAADPLAIAGAGFWLTFGATAALLMLAARWRGITAWRPLALATTGVVASLAVEALLMPISAYVFERVTLAGLALNLIAVPAMGLVQIAASACVALDLVGLGGLARDAGSVTHLAADVLVESAALVSRAPWSTWRVAAPSLALVALYYALVFVWWWVSGPPVDTLARVRWTRVLAGGLTCVWLWIATAPWTWTRPRPDGTLRVTAMDVGQGEALLLTTPTGRTVMVDAGGLPGGALDVGDRVLGPALRARGLRRLDYVAVTHGDTDHVGGAAALWRDFAPRELWAGVPVAGHAPLDVVRQSAEAARTPVRWLQRGDRLSFSGLELVVHHPPLPDWERQRVRNDDSLVLELRFGAVSVWLTGDISTAVEQDLLDAVDPARIHVLKAAHHGSRTSSGVAWLRRMRPVVVLVSAGRGNLFGHPAPSVLQRARDVGAAVFRTDEDGQIELTTNGHYLEVATYTGRRWRLR